MLIAPLPAAGQAALYMAEEAGCLWCARWNAEIGPIYPKTGEGRAAPLVRYDLNADDPGIEFARRVHYTPTFILVEDGRELGRIEGYPGEDFFWGLLGMLMSENGIFFDEAG
ncbi:MAG: hypothetical protein QNJ13_00385 [Paracoccaceae bacterium]|nr:hypothetical protein [Paracoccaceae bacterium]